MQDTRMPTSFRRSLEKTNAFLEEVREVTRGGDLDAAYQVTRATLHALRDRLPPNEAVDLAAQLPFLLRGVFYEGWTPSRAPRRLRTLEDFLEDVYQRLPRSEPEVEPVVRAVLGALVRRVSPGEIDDVKAVLPGALRTLWPARETAVQRVGAAWPLPAPFPPASEPSKPGDLRPRRESSPSASRT